MPYLFFLGVVPLPVTPGALTVSTPSQNVTINLINHGEVNIPRPPGLCEISFEFMLPRFKYPFANYGVGTYYTAATLKPLLQKWKETQLPFQFIVTRMAPDNTPLDWDNIKCLVEDYTFDEDASKHGFDVMCSIKLKEYKDYPTLSTLLQKVKDTAVNAAIGAGATAVVAVATKQRDTSSKQVPKTYTVKQGDTLWNICKKYLGDGSKYKEIAKLNKLENPDLIYPGQELRLS